MYCFKNKDGINMPIVIVIVDFLREKGYYISDKYGCYIETCYGRDMGNAVGALIKDSRPPRSRFWGLIKDPWPSMFLGYFSIKSLEDINFYIFGKDNINLASKLSKELTEYVNNLFEKNVKIEVFLASECLKHETFPYIDY